MTMTQQEALKEAIEFYEGQAALDCECFERDVANALRKLQNPWQPMETVFEHLEIGFYSKDHMGVETPQYKRKDVLLLLADKRVVIGYFDNDDGWTSGHIGDEYTGGYEHYQPIAWAYAPTTGENDE
jgi:hypothetical protein